jgi:hypothetical protein
VHDLQASPPRPSLFESLSNPDYCDYRVLSFDGHRWKLDRPFEQWRDSPDGTTQVSP